MELRNLTNLTRTGNTAMASKSSAKVGVEKASSEDSTPSDLIEIGAGKQANEPLKPSIQSGIDENKPAVSKSVDQGIKPADLKPFERSLYKVDSDGSMTKVKFIYDAGGRENLDNLTLVGSWDKNTGHYTNKWENSAVSMNKGENGLWSAEIPLKNEPGRTWQWGVMADGPHGKQTWAVFEEGNLTFHTKPGQTEKTVEYAPTTFHKMGCTRQGDDASFRYWAPNAQDVKVRVWEKSPEDFQLIDMKKDEKGFWNALKEGGWKELEGKSYAYQVTTSEGEKTLRVDPYARFLQGQQRGIAQVYLHPKTGKEVHQFYVDPSQQEKGEPSWERHIRFEIDGHEDAKSAVLKLYDQQGNQLDKSQLMERLGPGKPELVEKLHQGLFNDHWSKNVDPDGSVRLRRQGDAWAAIFNNPTKLAGLAYKFEVHKEDDNGNTHIVGDTNRDGVLSFEEAQGTHYNDPHTPVISEKFGWQRYGLIKECNYEWKNDHVPRMVESKEKAIIYQMHIGSVFGKAGNVDRSTFKDVIEKLEYFKDLGVNTLQVMPTNTFEKQRDWGYIGTNSMAQTNQYGFVDDDGSWVCGNEALKRFIDEAHGMGFNVFNDVVYNHWGGDYNHLWEHDGKKNPYFDWNENPRVPEQSGSGVNQWLINEPAKDEKRVFPADPTQKPAKTKKEEMQQQQEAKITDGVRHTDWGAMPAFNKEPVRQFLTDHAMSQLDEFKFDGLRFDFTHPIHNQNWGGGDDGWTLLRRINRMAHYFHPDVTTAAEEFPNSEIIVTPAGPDMTGGAGFDQMWNTEYHHRLIYDRGRPGIMQEAARGWRTNMDQFMHQLIHKPGFTHNMSSATVITNHDEVGNADRTINTAMNHQIGKTPDEWERNVNRMVFGVGMLSPGTPIFFQGEESLANNHFSWGRPTTWDVGWEWKDVEGKVDTGNLMITDNKTQLLLDMAKNPDSDKTKAQLEKMSKPEQDAFKYISSHEPWLQKTALENIMRKQHHTFSREMTRFRASSPAFDGDAHVERVYTHNDDSVMAFKRKKDGDEFMVIASLNRNDLGDYNIPTDGGKWNLVFNSDAKMFGGKDYGSKFDVYGGPGSRFDIPKGGMLVYKRVG